MVHRGSKYFVWITALALLLGLTVTPAFATQGSQDTTAEKDSKSKKKKKKSAAADAWDAKSKKQTKAVASEESGSKSKKKKKSETSGQSDTKSKGKSKDKTSAAGQKTATAPATLAPTGSTPAASGDQPKKKSWFSKKDKSTTATPPPASGGAASTAPATPPPATPGKGATAGTPAQTPAQPGQVWVNLDSGVYHRGGRWYGKTKNGKFMSEADAVKAGYKEDKNEAKKKK
jgi:hypothetical protein